MEQTTMRPSPRDVSRSINRTMNAIANKLYNPAPALGNRNLYILLAKDFPSNNIIALI